MSPQVRTWRGMQIGNWIPRCTSYPRGTLGIPMRLAQVDRLLVTACSIHHASNPDTTPTRYHVYQTAQKGSVSSAQPDERISAQRRRYYPQTKHNLPIGRCCRQSGSSWLSKHCKRVAIRLRSADGRLILPAGLTVQRTCLRQSRLPTLQDNLVLLSHIYDRSTAVFP